MRSIWDLLETHLRPIWDLFETKFGPPSQWFVYSRDIIDNMRKCLLNRSRVPPRVIFTKVNFSQFICSLQSGNPSDSNNPLTKMHTLTNISTLKFNVEKSMKCSTRFNISFLAIMFVLHELNLAQNMKFFGDLDN